MCSVKRFFPPTKTTITIIGQLVAEPVADAENSQMQRITSLNWLFQI